MARPIRPYEEADESKARFACQNCTWTGGVGGVPGDLSRRLAQGDTIPNGECPACGSSAGHIHGTGESDTVRVIRALAHLRQARDLLVLAGCDRAVDKVRLALKSTEGAQRHVDRRRGEVATTA